MAVLEERLDETVTAVVRQDLLGLSVADLQAQVAHAAPAAPAAQRLEAFAALACAELTARGDGRACR